MFNQTLSFTPVIRDFDLHRFSRSAAHARFDDFEPRAAAHPQREVQRNPEIPAASVLEKALNSQGISLKDLDADDFSAENVAERILSSIHQAYGEFKQTSPDSGDRLFFREINQGLEKGFEEAKSILESLKVHEGKVAKDLEQTREKTLKGLEQFQSSVRDVKTKLEFQAQVEQSARTAEFQVETREGDLLTLSFSSQRSSSLAGIHLQNRDSELTAYQSTDSTSSQLSVSIQGDLNAEEQSAIQSLVDRMHKISDTFFSGDVQAAMRHAQKTGFDAAQLSGFSMDLSAQKSIQSVVAYRETSAPEQTIQPDLLGQAADFLNTAKQLLGQAPSELKVLPEPETAFGDLFTTIGNLSREVHSEVEREDDDDQELFAGLIDNLRNSAFDQDHDPEDS